MNQSEIDDAIEAEVKRLIVEERVRQQIEEGYTVEHDRAHGSSALLLAGISYLTSTNLIWPWDDSLFKQTTRKRDLVKAGALIMAAAEIKKDDTLDMLLTANLAAVIMELSIIIQEEVNNA